MAFKATETLYVCAHKQNLVKENLQKIIVCPSAFTVFILKKHVVFILYPGKKLT